MPAASVATGLFRSCHPLPSVAVTGFATVLAAAAGNGAGTCVLLAAAVLTGQLSVGWSNDRIDAERDRRVGHEGKPVAAGQVPLRLVEAALAISSAATVALSLLLGWRAGGVHLLAVAAAWAYNAGVKGTPLSWLPYAVAFGALPAVATLARPGAPAPRWWIVLVAALLGTAVNFVNAKQSLARHPRSDVSGLPDRIGGRASLVVAALLVAGCSALVTAGPAGGPRPIAWAGAALTAALLVVGVPLFWRRADDRTAFYGLLVVAPVQLLVLVVTARPFS
ncbi:MAG TPA: UbiA family prenyltransferase [Jatrophihabitans sp.]|nr:UbiA family prenyltransferase [Jatrophihabitans sp.]